MRLIDADALIDIFEDRLEKIRNRYGDYSGEAGVCAGALRLIRVQPTVEERKTGKWIKKMHVTETEKYTSYDPDWYCACCGAKYDPHIAEIVNFCYVCGADMRGEQGETD